MSIARSSSKLTNQVGNHRFLLEGCGSHQFQPQQEYLFQLGSVGERVQMLGPVPNLSFKPLVAPPEPVGRCGNWYNGVGIHSGLLEKQPVWHVKNGLSERCPTRRTRHG